MQVPDRTWCTYGASPVISVENTPGFEMSDRVLNLGRAADLTLGIDLFC